MTKIISEFEDVVKGADKRETAGKLYFPKDWIGKRVKVRLVK